MGSGCVTGQLKLPKAWRDFETRHAYASATAEQKLCWQLRITRIRQGLSMAQLARKAGVDRHTIAKYEGHVNNSNEEIRMSTLLKIARALDVAVCIELRSFRSLDRERMDLSEAALHVPSYPG